MRCANCGAGLRVVRVIVDGTSTWREERCTGKGRHVVITVEDVGNPRLYRRIRAKYLRALRKNDDTGIIKMRPAS